MSVLLLGSIAGLTYFFRADFIVQLDACFTHKRRTPARGTGRDASFRHPSSAFLSEQEVEAARVLVELARPTGPEVPHDEEDAKEVGMKVSRSTLDACSESFKAADEKKVKASSKFFADTGLMALICRHDRVLWLANMTTPGERQYYALALLLRLFKAIPSDLTVGVLYDIGCQLHRSCTKYNFIPEFIHRIIWGVSIFHAYGHQWSCQLVYHPRKCAGFGLSDGEGCERFWSSIQGLIPSLRVSGVRPISHDCTTVADFEWVQYHQRLLTIDNQIDFLQEEGFIQFGRWLRRKYDACAKRKGEAEVRLARSGYSKDALAALWADQVDVQTRPLVKATAGLSKASIGKILELGDYLKSLSGDISAIDRAIANGDEVDLDEMTARRGELVTQRDNVEAQIRKRKLQLGVTEQQNLKRLLSNRYLQVCTRSMELSSH